MYTEHDRHNDRLEPQNRVSIMTITVSIMSTLHPGAGKYRTEQNEMTLLYGCPTSAGAVILSMFYAPGTIEKSYRAHMITQWAKNVTLHTSVLPSFLQQILGITSLIHWLTQPTQNGLSEFLLGTHPSQMVSFSDWCFTFLHRMWGHSTHRPSWDLTANYVSQSWMSHNGILGRVLSPHAITGATTQSMSVCCSTVRWLARYQKVNWLLAELLAKACGFVVNIWSQTVGSWPIFVGSWSSCYTGSTGTDEPHKVFNYYGPHIGCQVLLWVFLSYALWEAQTLAHGDINTEALLVLLAGRFIDMCGKIQKEYILGELKKKTLQ